MQYDILVKLFEKLDHILLFIMIYKFNLKNNTIFFRIWPITMRGILVSVSVVLCAARVATNEECNVDELDVSCQNCTFQYG